MEKILLFSDNEELVGNIRGIVEGKYELIWRHYILLKKGEYPYGDVVIIDFDRKLIENENFESIIKIKGKLGNSIPILAIVEGASPQAIFSILAMGAYDYIELTDNLQDYNKKIKDLILWKRYLKKYKLKDNSK